MVLAEVELSSLVLGHCLVMDRKIMEVEIHQVEVDHFLDKDFLTGEEVEIRARDRVEDILDNLVVLDFNNLGAVEMDLEVGESHHQVEMDLEVGESHHQVEMGLEVGESHHQEVDLEDRVGLVGLEDLVDRVASRMGLNRVDGIHHSGRKQSGR